MPNERDIQEQERRNREALFQRRVAEMSSQGQEFLPWMMPESPQFEIPKEETKALADREVEEPGLSEAELERRAMMDLVSNNFNFRIFYKRLNYELRRARRYKRPLSVMLIGIDSLENIGLRYGADAKEEALRLAAKHVLGGIRDVDIPGRCREDTFGVILPETPSSGATIAAERIRTKIENVMVPVWQQQVYMTVTVGVAHYPDHGEKIEHFFGNAVQALLSTMQRGGNAVKLARTVALIRRFSSSV